MKPVSACGALGKGLVIALVCIAVVGVVATVAVDGFYILESYMHAYQQNEELMVKVNPLTSVYTQLPFGYYTLPFCQSEGGERHEAENIGELLLGDRIESSPYKFKTNVNESTVVLCVGPALDENQVKTFQQRIDESYQINLILDSWPAKRYTDDPYSDIILRRTGLPIGFKSYGFKSFGKYYIHNHLKFKVLIHDNEGVGVGSMMETRDGTDMSVPNHESGNNRGGYLVVGFEVIYCSVDHSFQKDESLNATEKIDPLDCQDGRYQEINVGRKIVYTYDVKFVTSEVPWDSQWDALLKMEGARLRWFPIVNSLLAISFLAGTVFMSFLRPGRRDSTRYEELDKEAQAQMAEELSRWKLVVRDVFRAPNHTALLCIMVGDGVQITGVAVVTILLAAFGFMSPPSRVMLLTGMVLLYLLLGIVGGYVASRLWSTLKRDPRGWVGVSLGVAFFFPGIAFATLTVPNVLLSATGSPGAIPISLFFILLARWFCISVPLTLLGGFLGARAEQISYPVRANQIPIEFLPQKYPSWLLVLRAGTLPCGTSVLEFFFIMSCIWMVQPYHEFVQPVVRILFAASGFMSRPSRGVQLTGILLGYVFPGIAGGYAAFRLWTTLKRDPKRWREVRRGVSCFFPDMAFAILTRLNYQLTTDGSTGAVLPVLFFFILPALWLSISIRWILRAGFRGARAQQISNRVRSNQTPREIPPEKYPSWLLVFGAGILPFGALFIELFFIMSSIWMGRVYDGFGLLFAALVLLVVSCAEVSALLTYVQLRAEDWAWRWKSYFASGSVALYVLLYALYYLAFSLRTSGTVAVVLFVAYSSLMALAVMLGTGAVGFLVSFCLVHYVLVRQA